MSNLRGFISNLSWAIICTKEMLLHYLSCFNVKRVQKNILLQTIKKNKHSIFGKQFNFSEIKTVREFQNMIPIQKYDEYHKWIELLQNGKVDAITEDTPIILEPTSGSSGKLKLIPYTKNLHRQFLQGIRPWIFHILCSDKRIMRGRAYWSITPLMKQEFSSTGSIPVGFKNDGEYFGNIERKLLGNILVTPNEVSEISDLENFRYATLFFLIYNQNLSFISVWSPTFLTTLLECLSYWKNSIVNDLKTGHISFPREIDVALKERLERNVRPNFKRAVIVKNAFSLKEKTHSYKMLWPDLAIISCWADGSSANYAKELNKLFPEVKIQAKGLLATEGIVSIPVCNKYDAVLSVRSHFFEFIEVNDSKIKLAHELKVGKKYSVVLTTGGGLYRYRLGDLIEVTGFFHKCPAVKFISREEYVSDLFGEKLNENFISQILESQFKKNNIQTSFFLIAPEYDENKSISYTLFLEIKESEENNKEEFLKSLAVFIENELIKSFHYEYCRKLNQLAPFRIFFIESGGVESYLNACVSSGQRLGDVKMKILSKDIGWKNIFKGRLINRP